MGQQKIIAIWNRNARATTWQTNAAEKKDVRCVLCGGNHPASYKGRTVYKDLQKKTYPPLHLKQYTPAQIKQTLHTQPGVTHVQITKHNSYAATNIEQNQHINQPHQQTSNYQDLKKYNLFCVWAVRIYFALLYIFYIECVLFSPSVRKKLELTSSTIGCSSVGMVWSRTEALKFVLFALYVLVIRGRFKFHKKHGRVVA
jgi:uncharacterized membrane protein (DUF485 family)